MISQIVMGSAGRKTDSIRNLMKSNYSNVLYQYIYDNEHYIKHLKHITHCRCCNMGRAEGEADSIYAISFKT